MTRLIRPQSRLALDCLTFKTLERSETPNGRMYIAPNGLSYPSVTTVIGSTADTAWLQEWRDRIGEAEADRIGQQAATRGTAYHSLVASFLMGHEIPVSYGGAWFSFMSTWKFVEEIQEVKMLECAVVNSRLKYAGTLDIFATFRGKRTLIDLKSYRANKPKEDLEDAFVQCAMYAMSDDLAPYEPESVAVIYGSETSSGCMIESLSEGLKQTARKRIRDYWNQMKIRTGTGASYESA